MNEKIVRAASKFITNVGKIIIFIAVLSLIRGITYDTGDAWDGLSRIIFAALGILLLIVNTPFYRFGVNTLKYLKGERKSLKRSTIYGIISLTLNSLLIYLFIIRDITRNLESFSTGEVYIGRKIILTVILFFTFIFPILVNLVQFLKLKYNNTNISENI